MEKWKIRTIRMSDELYEKIRNLAKEENKTIAEYVRVILEEKIKETN